MAMKKTIKYFVIFIFAITCVICSYEKTKAITKEEAVGWANAQIGKGLDYDGVYGNQCVDLIKYYYAYFGVAGYARGNAEAYRTNSVPPGWTRIYGGYQPGDVVVWSPGLGGSDKTYGHIGIIDSIDEVGFNAVNQNYANKSYCTKNWFNNSCIACCIRPPYTPSTPPDSTPPVISNILIQNVSKDSYRVICTVTDNVGVARVTFPSWNNTTNRGEDAIWYEGNISGNTAWVDVKFSDLPNGDKPGNYLTDIYAYDSAGNYSTGRSPFVTIERNIPMISSVKVVEVDQYGYWVEIVATDDSGIDRIECPTWTIYNGQDDLGEWKAASFIGNNTYRFRVKIQDHNSERGNYRTHVYAFDKSGNSACLACPDVMIEEGARPKRIMTCGEKMYSYFDEEVGFERAQNFAKAYSSNLASITNETEQNAVEELLQGSFYDQYYLGGYRQNESKPWQWMTLDGMDYTNWAQGEPNCAGGNEFYIAISSKNGTWNDMPGSNHLVGFVMETPAQLKFSSTVETDDAKYEFYKQALPYEIAEEYAKVHGGRLAVIKSAKTNEILAKKATDLDMSFFIGLTDAKKEGEFVWADGSQLEYSNFAKGEPNNVSVSLGPQNYVQMYSDGTWDDTTSEFGAVCGFIVEYPKQKEPQPTATPKETSTPAPTQSASPSPSFTAVPTTTPTSTPMITKTEPPKTQEKLSNPIVKEDTTTWDCINFGNYWQDEYTPQNVPDCPEDGEVYTDSDGTRFIASCVDCSYYDDDDEYVEDYEYRYFVKQPIKWRVLSVDGNNAFVIADKAIDCQKYNDEEDDITWEDCTLRDWLNDSFLKSAFTTDEQSAISNTTVINKNNTKYDTEGGNDTEDKIYLLSEKEVTKKWYGFNDEYDFDSETRHCKATQYAISRNCYYSKDDYDGNCYWWLRSPGSIQSDATCVGYTGWGYYGGNYVSNDQTGIRPVMNIDLSTADWYNAGKITAYLEDGNWEKDNQMKKKSTITKVPQSIQPTSSYKLSTQVSKPRSLLKQKITTTKIKTYKASKLKKNSITFNLKAKTSGDGKLTYKVTNGKSKYIKVTKKGKVTLKKKCKKGTYKIKITASKTAKYYAASKVVKIKVA